MSQLNDKYENELQLYQLRMLHFDMQYMQVLVANNNDTAVTSEYIIIKITHLYYATGWYGPLLS